MSKCVYLLRRTHNNIIADGVRDKHFFILFFFSHFFSRHQFFSMRVHFCILTATTFHLSFFIYFSLHNKMCMIFFFLLVAFVRFFFHHSRLGFCLLSVVSVKPANGIQTKHNQLSKSHGRSEFHLNTIPSLFFKFLLFIYAHDYRYVHF